MRPCFRAYTRVRVINTCLWHTGVAISGAGRSIISDRVSSPPHILENDVSDQASDGGKPRGVGCNGHGNEEAVPEYYVGGLRVEEDDSSGHSV